MFPTNMLRLDYSFFYNQLRINIARRSYFFDTIVNVKVLKFIQLLYKLGYIRRYLKTSSKKYRIFPNWVNGRSALSQVRFFQKKTPLKLSYKALLILKLNTFNSYMILSTDKGLLTHQDALKFRIGGHLICFIL